MRALAVLVAATALACDGLQSAHRMPSAGMAPTLLPGDWFLADHIRYAFSDPRRGDVVLYSREGERFVQRVVGIPGDVIDVRANRLTLNGEPIPLEPIGATLDLGTPLTLFRERSSERSYGVALAAPDSPGPYPDVQLEVPEGHYFVLGDYRDNSRDSRSFGTIPRAKILGDARWIYFSYDADAGEVRWERIGDAIE